MSDDTENLPVYNTEVQHYGVFDSSGLPKGFYNDDVYPNGVGIPSTAVKITKQQWETFINNPGAKMWNGTDVIDYSIPITNNLLLAYASDQKKMYETNGITINGYSVATDRQSQAMINQTVVSLTINPNLVMDWRNPDGSFTTLTADFVRTIAYYVSLHVSTTFTALNAATTQIKNGSLKSFSDIDAFYQQAIKTDYTTPPTTVTGS